MFAAPLPGYDELVVERQVTFSLVALCRASGGQRAQMIALVQEGVLQPAGNGPETWQFGGTALRTARTATRLARDFELDVTAIALVLELLEHIDTLDARLRRSGLN